jgi:hypothetical protein
VENLYNNTTENNRKSYVWKDNQEQFMLNKGSQLGSQTEETMRKRADNTKTGRGVHAVCGKRKKCDQRYKTKGNESNYSGKYRFNK